MTNVSIQYVSVDTEFEEIIPILDRDGVICIRGVLSDDQINNLRSELDPHFEKTKFCVGSFVGARTKRLNGLVVKSAVAQDMMINSRILEVMSYLLPNCDKIQINITQGIQIWPGQRAQTIHTDDVMFPLKTRDCETMVDAMWAYSDFTKENGATVIVPGSHRWNDSNRIPQEHECVQAEMKAGDVLIYVGSLLHNGGANISDNPRTGILISYCLGWLRQFENQYLVAPPAVAKYFKPKLQELLGYAIHRPNLGQYEGNEPTILFASDKTEALPTHDYLTPVGYEMIAKVQALEDAGRRLPPTVEQLMSERFIKQPDTQKDSIAEKLLAS